MAETLGILLTTSAEHQDVHTVSRLARAAREQGRDVRVFVMCDGVYNLKDPGLRELAARGVQVSVCGQNAEQRHIEPIEDIPNVTWGSQYDFAQITAECDRVIAFN